MNDKLYGQPIDRLRMMANHYYNLEAHYCLGNDYKDDIKNFKMVKIVYINVKPIRFTSVATLRILGMHHTLKVALDNGSGKLAPSLDTIKVWNYLVSLL